MTDHGYKQYPAGILGKDIAEAACSNKREESGSNTDTDDETLTAPPTGCEYRLDCGHTCPGRCRISDGEHVGSKLRCLKHCVKRSCTNKEHICRKPCAEDCGPCQYPLKRVLPRCGHEQTVKCGDDMDNVVCKQPCNQTLRCGHKCVAICAESCTKLCLVMVTRELRCGHKQQMSCHKPYDNVICEEKCAAVLQCGHPCCGNCYKCYGGHLHEKCGIKCKRKLECGHICTELCTSEECPPCKEKCKNRCVHSRCPKKCSEGCVICTERCAWQCKHKACTKLCYEICDRERCNEPCKQLVPERPNRGDKSEKRRSCGHPCIGICGEPCPKLCRICDKEKVEEIFFGDENEPNKRFIKLIDCGHIFSVDGLDRWMDETSDRIRLKRCPKCKMEIRQSFRYGNVVKRSLEDEEKVRLSSASNAEDISYIRTMVIKAQAMLTGPIHTSRYSTSQKEVQYEKLKTLWENLLLFVNIESHKKHFTRSVVIAYKYKAQFMNELVRMLTEYQAVLKSKGIQQSEMKDYKIFVQDLCKITDFIRVGDTSSGIPRQFFSEQQLEDVEWFLTRLKMCSQFILLANFANLCRVDKGNRYASVQENPAAESCRRLLRPGPFRQNTMDAVQENLAIMKKSCPGLNIAEERKVQIARVMSCPRGRWYKCPQGHVYFISYGDCSGGAVHESRCAECNALDGPKKRVSVYSQPAPEMVKVQAYSKRRMSTVM